MESQKRIESFLQQPSLASLFPGRPPFWGFGEILPLAARGVQSLRSARGIRACGSPRMRNPRRRAERLRGSGALGGVAALGLGLDEAPPRLVPQPEDPSGPQVSPGPRDPEPPSPRAPEYNARKRLGTEPLGSFTHKKRNSRSELDSPREPLTGAYSGVDELGVNMTGISLCGFPICLEDPKWRSI